MSLYASFNGTLGTTIDEVESILTHTSWRYRGPHEIKAVGKSGLLRGVQAQQQKTVSSIRAIAKAAQDLAQAANQSTQLINDAIGGHVLIRREPGGTNEILIMDHEDPAQATKIWRWNMGGLGYSDNVIGADNPAREYTVAMTMDGAINADFIKTGALSADFIGAGTLGADILFAGELYGATGTFDGIVTAQAFIAGARSATVIVAKEGTVNARRADVVVPESGYIHQPETFELDLGGATGGSFKLGDGEAETEPIPYDADSAAIKTALETVYGVGKAAVNLTGKITWQQYAGLTWNEVNGL